MEEWIINNKKVTFDEACHQYEVNGKKCISVTQLLKFKYPRKYEGISNHVLQAKAKVGTELHNAIEIYETYGIERNDLIEFRNYKFLKKRFKWWVEETEVPILLEYKDLYVCGRLDQVQKLLNEKVGCSVGLADIKHTSSLDKEYLAYQLNLYRLGYIQSYNRPVDFLKGIHLNRDDRKYVDIPINENIAYELLEDYINEKSE